LQQCGGYDGSLNTQRVDTCCSSSPRPAPPTQKAGWVLGTLGPRPKIRAGIKAFGGKKCGACLHVATLPATDWVVIGSVNPTSPGGRRPPLARTAEGSVAARTPSGSLTAIRGQRASTGLINQTRPSRRLKATFRDGHHILWCRAVLILTRNLGGSNAKTVSFWICRRSNRVGHDCLGRSQYRHTPSRPCSAKGGAGAVRTHPGPTLPGITPGLLIGLSGTKLPS
jgi:hypothetical protein